MKPAVTLVFFLLCILTGRFGYAHVSGHQARVCFLHHIKAEKKELRGLVLSNTNFFNQATADIAQAEDVLCVEDEDPDEINKPFTDDRYFIAFYYAFVAGDKKDISAAPFSSHQPLFYSGACKYITLRTLRI